MSDKQADRILGKARRALETSELPRAFKNAAPPSEGITDERLTAAYEALASIISLYGNEYVPLFERLHNEIENRNHSNELLKIARAIHDRKYER